MNIASPTAVIDKRTYLLLFASAFLIYFITASGRAYSSDGQYVYALTRAIVDHHSVDVSPYMGVKYSQFPPLRSVLMIPFYAAWKPFQRLTSPYLFRRDTENLPLSFFNVLVTSLSVVALAAAAIEAGAGAAGALAVALLWAFATMAWPYSKMDFSEPLLCLWVILALLYAYRAVRTGSPSAAALVGFLMSLCVLTKYESGPYAPLFFFAIFGRAEGRWKRATAFAAASLPVLLAGMAYNHYRFGSVFNTGYVIKNEFEALYSKPYPAYEILYGILLSSGKSLFVYAPPLLLALFGAREFLRGRRSFVVLALAVLTVNFIIFKGVACWGGALSWGPRYFMINIPIGLWIAAPWVGKALSPTGGAWRKSLIIALAAAGIAVQLVAVSIRMNTAYENGSVDECIHLRFSGGRDMTPEEILGIKRFCTNPILKETRILAFRAPRTIRVMREALAGDARYHDQNSPLRNTYLDFWPVYMYPFLKPRFAWTLTAVLVVLCAAAAATLIPVLRALCRAARADAEAATS